MHRALKEGKYDQVNIVVSEGKVTLEDLHSALDRVIKDLSGCLGCGLAGFDVKFVRGDPELRDFADIRNIQNIHGGYLTRG